MSRLSVRVFLLVVCLGAISGSAFHLWSTERRVFLAAGSHRQFNSVSRAVSSGIGDLRAAQQAYVAVGQGDAFWFDRVTAIQSGLGEQLALLRTTATAADATGALDDAAAALQDFAQMDPRARDYTRHRELALASDMVFTNGIELTRRAGDAIARATAAEQVAHEAAIAAVRKTQALALAAAAAVCLIALLMLVPGRRRATGVSPISIAPAPADILTDLDDFRPPVRTTPPAGPPAPLPAPAAPVGTVDIAGIATLCNDLARITDTRGLAALLDRAATVLDASGIIIWIADPDGRELAPILVHGYPPHLANRLGTLARNAENLTASAYRTALLQTVRADKISIGAIAVPLVAPGGCVGVLAAEVRNGGEQQEQLLAAATIIAAQLATLVGPPAARAKSEAAS
jgi:hypothetical protein